MMRNPIIFFDGECGMCNTFVDVILRVDKRSIFLFAPLQGETATRLLPSLSHDPHEWSMVYLDEAGIHQESDASLEVYRRLGGWWKLLAVAQMVPLAIRTPIYRWVARNRYRLFGKKDSCRIPSTAERERFLD